VAIVYIGAQEIPVIAGVFRETFFLIAMLAVCVPRMLLPPNWREYAVPAKAGCTRDFFISAKYFGWITVQNPHRFIDELIEIGGFAKNIA
jgi:hypothetical protein